MGGNGGFVVYTAYALFFNRVKFKMRISKWMAAFSVVTFIVIDTILSSLFYVKNDRIAFSFGELIDSYSFWSSQLEHCMLALVRLTLLLGALIGICYNPRNAIERVSSGSLSVVCICLMMAVYSLVKLLALAETTWNFRLPWFWSLFGWNISASGLCALIWTMVLTKTAVSEPTVVEMDGSGQIESDRAILVENEARENCQENYARRRSEESAKSDDKEKTMKVRVKKATSLFWRLIKYTKPESPWYSLGFVFLLFYSAARIFIPYYTGRVISDVVVERSYSRLLNSVLIMSIFAIGSSIFAGLRGGCFSYAIAKMGTRIRSDLFSSLVKQEIGFFDVTKTGDITSRLSADCQTVSDTIALNFNVFLRSIIMAIGALVFMFKLSWQLTVLTFIAMPLIGVITKIYGNFYERLSKEAQDSLAKANEVAEEVLSSMRTVRSFANESGEGKRYDEKMTQVLKVRTKQTVAYVGYTWINEIFDLVMLIAVLWYGGHLVLNNRLKSEDLIAYLLYQLQLGESIMAIGWVFTGLMQAVGASGKVFEWIDRKPEVSNDGEEVPSSVSGRVEFKDVSFAYPSRPDVDVLKDINFTAEPGEVVALVGPSGGGKSSCLALLEHFYEPKSGMVQLDGVPVQCIDHAYFHRMVSLVGQEPVLFARSVRENISYGLNEDEWKDQDVTQSSKLANAHDFIAAMPSAYDTDVGEKGVQLSGGQKQRIAIARALIRKPKVLLLDEATSALDAESEYLVKQAIHQNLVGHTVLLIAHRLSTVEKADKIVVIDGGRVVQEGNHAQLLTQDGLYRNLVHRQLLGEGISSSTAPQSAATSASRTIPPPGIVYSGIRGSPVFPSTKLFPSSI